MGILVSEILLVFFNDSFDPLVYIAITERTDFLTFFMDVLQEMITIEKPERCWNGLIDDVRIYSYALSQQEIKAICGGEGSDLATQRTEVGLALTER